MTITPGGSAPGTYSQQNILDFSKLPQHEGRPVPWITRWTGEVSREGYSLAVERDGPVLYYEEGGEDRDPRGFMWKREGIGRNGEPQYSEVNTYRQRAAMRKRLCQVCGTKIDARPIRWLLSRQTLHWNDDPQLGALTRSAPTCSDCIPLALELCPHLRQDAIILKVLDYELWGIYGEGIEIDQENGKGRQLRGIHVSYGDPGMPLSSVVAFQEVVRLTKFVVEEEVNP